MLASISADGSMPGIYKRRTGVHDYAGQPQHSEEILMCSKCWTLMISVNSHTQPREETTVHRGGGGMCRDRDGAVAQRGGGG